MDRYSFRDAVVADADVIASIFNEQVTTTPAVYTEIEVTVENRRNLIVERQIQKFPFIVAVSTNDNGVEEVVGYVTYGPFRTATGYSHTVEHSLYIHKRHRGQGLGSKLMQLILSEAKIRGVHVMVAGADSENETSIALHQRFGFVEVGRMPEVGRKWDSWRTLVLMQLIIQ
jgi:L-amino acid N-acyltransferase